MSNDAEIEKLKKEYAQHSYEMGLIAGRYGKQLGEANELIQTLTEVFKRIAKKEVMRVGTSEAADMAVEFQLEAKVALEEITAYRKPV